MHWATPAYDIIDNEKRYRNGLLLPYFRTARSRLGEHHIQLCTGTPRAVFVRGRCRKESFMPDITRITTGDESLYPSLAFRAQDLVPEALLFSITTKAGRIEGDAPVVRVPIVTADPSPAFVREGQQITRDTPELAEVRFNTAKLGNIFRQSNESATSDNANNLLALSMKRSIVIAADTALLQNNPGEQDADWQPTGLFNDTSIPVSADTFGTAGKPSESFNAVSNAITTISVNGGNASHIVMHPNVWKTFTDAIDANGRSILGDPATATEKALWGLPVIVTSCAPDGKILVLDKTAIVSADSNILFSKSGEAAFEYDSIVWRTTFRLGWKPVKPKRCMIINKATNGK